jgi:hypothetical protein
MRHWERHVRKDRRTAMCGANLGPAEWCFVDADHARAAVDQGSFLQPCPECRKAIGGEE